MSIPPPDIQPELSRPVSLLRLPPEGLSIEIAADAEELAALCRRLELDELRALNASVGVFHHGSAEVFAVRGKLQAAISQTCVVSLESFPSEVTLTFERLFTTGEMPEEEEEVTIDPALLDLEPVDGESLDLGEIVVEELAVNLEPYPRAPGYELPLEEEEPSPEDGPFAALAALRSGDKDAS
jgi:uncharacterized metal-binding protein YceD (DUF177 family)